MKNIVEVIKMIDKYDVSDILPVCLEFLNDNANINDIVDIYYLTLQRDLGELQQFCVFKIENTENIFEKVNFLNWSKEMLSVFLDLELQCEEADFEACVAWAQKKCDLKEIQKTACNLRIVLGDIVTKIRFSSMAPEEFSTILSRYPDFF